MGVCDVNTQFFAVVGIVFLGAVGVATLASIFGVLVGIGLAAFEAIRAPTTTHTGEDK
jgi:hypothetical protein